MAIGIMLPDGLIDKFCAGEIELHALSIPIQFIVLLRNSGAVAVNLAIVHITYSPLSGGAKGM